MRSKNASSVLIFKLSSLYVPLHYTATTTAGEFQLWFHHESGFWIVDGLGYRNNFKDFIEAYEAAEKFFQNLQ